MKLENKIGIVDVGGGYRGIYAAGVLDTCMRLGIHFDVCIGVSAGSANMASYLAGQRERNKVFYSQYGLRKQYAGMGNFLRKGSYIDLDYIYSVLSNSDGEYPLDYQGILSNSAEFLTVATEAETGRVKYFDKTYLRQNNYDIFKASSAIPFICRPYKIGGIPYYDGALADPVPVQKAFDMGCDKVVLLLTLPADTKRSQENDIKLAKRIRKKYPIAADMLEQRALRYTDGVNLAKRYVLKDKVLIIAPDDTCGVSTLCRDRDALLRFYKKACRMVRKFPIFYLDNPFSPYSSLYSVSIRSCVVSFFFLPHSKKRAASPLGCSLSFHCLYFKKGFQFLNKQRYLCHDLAMPQAFEGTNLQIWKGSL